MARLRAHQRPIAANRRARMKPLIHKLERAEKELQSDKHFVAKKVRPSLDRKQRKLLQEVVDIISSVLEQQACKKSRECGTAIRAAIMERFGDRLKSPEHGGQMPNEKHPADRTGITVQVPAVGLLRISSLYKSRGDAVTFARGCTKPAKRALAQYLRFFLVHWKLPRTVRTIQYYLRSVSRPENLVVGGIAATLMPSTSAAGSRVRLSRAGGPRRHSGPGCPPWRSSSRLLVIGLGRLELPAKRTRTSRGPPRAVCDTASSAAVHDWSQIRQEQSLAGPDPGDPPAFW